PRRRLHGERGGQGEGSPSGRLGQGVFRIGVLVRQIQVLLNRGRIGDLASNDIGEVAQAVIVWQVLEGDNQIVVCVVQAGWFVESAAREIGGVTPERPVVRCSRR